MTGSHHDEERLVGGNISDVYRLGNTVRRKVKPGSANIHNLLHHLDRKGFNYSPTFMGFDENGREVLSFIEGEAGHDYSKSFLWSNSAFTDIAHMLRQYHDAVKDFPIQDEWKPIDLTPQPLECICHNDFALYNIIFKNGRPVGVIDFDVAAPGPRLWDIAYTLYTCVPLSRISYDKGGTILHYDREQHASTKRQKINLFFEAYGEEVPQNLIEMVLLRLEGLCTYMKRKASEGDKAFQAMINEGHFDHYQRDILFIKEYGAEWL